MAKRPYRFSKKAGKYIPNTQSGNREYYHKLLSSIEPHADFDPNSTYGKHIIKKTISELRKYKRTQQDYKEHQNSLSSQLRRLTKLQTDNKREENFRRNNAINDRASKIVEQKNSLIAFTKKRAFIIAIALAVVTYFVKEEFQISFWVFLGSYVSLAALGNWLFDQLKKSNLSQAENDLINMDFGRDLWQKVKSKQEEINRTRNEIENLHQQLQTLENQIIIKVQELLNEDKLKFILSDQFYNSTDWKKIRDQALSTYENVCVECGSTENLSVDHVYPRSRFPEKALELSNTQVLCLRCNSSKGNRLTLNKSR